MMHSRILLTVVPAMLAVVHPATAQSGIRAQDRLRILEGFIRNRGGFMDDAAPIEACSLLRLLGHSVRLDELNPPIIVQNSRLFLVPVDGCDRPRRCSELFARQLIIRGVEGALATNDSTAVVSAEYRSGEYSHRETFLMRRIDRPLPFLQWSVVEVRQTGFVQEHLPGCSPDGLTRS
jgi:hypothetical protein